MILEAYASSHVHRLAARLVSGDIRRLLSHRASHGVQVSGVRLASQDKLCLGCFDVASSSHGCRFRYKTSVLVATSVFATDKPVSVTPSPVSVTELPFLKRNRRFRYGTRGFLPVTKAL